MKKIKILGPGCAKCKTTYQNVLAALESTDIQADVEKVEDIEEMMKYNILSTPALMIDDEILVKGRVAQVKEIKELLKA
jgi:small redox-active disulfide protein 2